MCVCVCVCVCVCMRVCVLGGREKGGRKGRLSRPSYDRPHRNPFYEEDCWMLSALQSRGKFYIIDSVNRLLENKVQHPLSLLLSTSFKKT